MILILDNYDSFTYNLVQYIGELNQDLQIFRNDKITADEIIQKKPTHIVISPGPCTPAQAGISVELIQKTPATIPLLGVCLGHQCIASAFGGDVIKAPYLMHGKTSEIICEPSALFAELPNKFTATRYHSLIVKKETLPEPLKITAKSEDGIIMAMEHKINPIFGLQFHPESILTDHGKSLINNFINLQGAS